VRMSVIIVAAITVILGLVFIPRVIAAVGGPRVIDVGTEGAGAVAISPDGRMLYAAESTDADADSITVVDLATGQTVKRIEVGGMAGRLVVIPNGRMLYAIVGSWLVRIDLPSGHIADRLQFTHGLWDIAALPTGVDVLVLAGTPGHSRAVISVDASSGKEESAIPVPRYAQVMAISPDSRVLYVGTAGGEGSSELLPFDVGTGKTGTPILFSHGIVDVAFGPDKSIIYVLAQSDAATAACSLVAIDRATGATRRLATLGCGELKVSPNGRMLFVLGLTTLSWVNSVTGTLEGSASTHGFMDGDTDPIDFVITPDDRTAYVADEEQGVVVLPVAR
jgi:DNA-binding beta-propeller fold protein YncE